jgi:phenylacetate-CoA ligase
MVSAAMPLAPYLALLVAYRTRLRDQWAPPDALGRIRLARLRKLVEAAWTAPYYRRTFTEAGLHPADFRSEDVLRRLPLFEKDVVRNSAPEELLTESAKSLFLVTTSGSTGQPLRVLRSARDQAEISATWMRLQRAHGRRFYYRQVNIGSRRPTARSGPVVALQKLGVVPHTHQLSSFEPIDKQIEVLRRVKPHVISGYSIALENLAAAMVDAGVRDVRPAIIIGGGMEVTDRCRLMVERAFGRRLTNVYATNELGPIAWECPDTPPGALHLNEDVQIVEIVDDDGRPVPDGQSGHVVVTQLNCTAQPLIRYRIGDIASLLPQRCACGRRLGLMSEVQGRAANTIRFPGGRVLNNVIVSSILSIHQEVRRYQIRQVGLYELLIAVVPGEKWTATSGETVIRSFRERLGESLRYELVTCDDIPLTSQGKFQTVVPMTE